MSVSCDEGSRRSKLTAHGSFRNNRPAVIIHDREANSAMTLIVGTSTIQKSSYGTDSYLNSGVKTQ
jgi:hypothetical protein